MRIAGVADARRDAGLLMAHVLGRDRSYILIHANDPLANECVEPFRGMIARRATGEPLQYITGSQEFFNLNFEVTTDVLIPRPETELSVEVALELLKDVPEPLIADIGTGSGCIVISLLHELPRARAIAVDISPAALRVAQRNAERHGVTDRLTLIESDCFATVEAPHQFSLIVSNPPYVAEAEIETLQREVREHEPRVALVCGLDGLAVIRRLLRDAPRFLRTGGHFIFEIGFGQSDLVKQIIEPRVWNLLEIRKDLQGIPRTVVLQKQRTVSAS